MIAVIGDIHSNFEALTAVLSDISAQGVRKIICIGDVIGFGPDPCACVDLVMQSCKETVLGNHDMAAFSDPEGFNPVALKAVYWTREQLERRSEGRQQRWDFLGKIPRRHEEGDFLFVHGSPREPTHEYVFPEDIYNQRKMDQVLSRFRRYCILGHTHLPGIFTADYQFIAPKDCGYRYRLSGEKALINVGSVGQPRDGDERACYVLLDGYDVTFRRVEYDVETTRRKLSDLW
jgi:diadenosine tetraphosphatase ApaH/serine/threonine PP2A family protein phosphatase